MNLYQKKVNEVNIDRNKKINIIAEELDRNEIKYIYNDEDEDDVLYLPFDSEDKPPYTISILCYSNGSISVFSEDIMLRVPEKKREHVLNACNTLNSKYKYAKVSIVNKNRICVAYDLPAEISDECIGKVAFEMVVTVARIIGITYSSIYNVLMGNAEIVSNNASLPSDDNYSSLSSNINLQNDPLIGKTINGKYLVISLIGRGALTYVYLVKDLALNTAWAMKAITSKTSGNKNAVIYNSILTEANIMKRLNHPAFPKIVDIVENDDGIFLVMEYIEGNTLKEIVAERGIQPVEQVVDWSKQICDALRYLHSYNPPYIYRDMKPGNVIIRPNGAIAIVDFGIARTYKVGQSEDTCALGTRGYAAPEQYGGAQTDVRTDIYGLGMTMYNLITGKDPTNSKFSNIPVCQVNPNLPKRLEYIISKCTKLKPEERYQNCNELMADLNNYLFLPKPQNAFGKLFGKR